MYSISNHGQMTRDVPPAWGLGVELITIISKLVTKSHSLGPGRILWINDLRDGIWT
jgi:hypothetical protein